MYRLSFFPSIFCSPNSMEPVTQYSLAFFFIILAYKLYKKLTLRLPPGPRPWPVVGNLYSIQPVKFQCFTEWAQYYGPIISVWFGSSLNVVVSNSELAREVLKENDQQLADRHRSWGVDNFSKGGKDLLWADYGPHYVKVKRVCTFELFSPKRIEALRPIREDEVNAMIKSIFKVCTKPENKGKGLQLKQYLSAAAFNNITRITFGRRFESLEAVVTDEQWLELRNTLTNGLNLGSSITTANHIPLLRCIFPLKEKAWKTYRSMRDKLTKQIMDEYTLARGSKKGAAKPHFLDALLTLQEEYELSDDTITSVLWDMVIAGVDMTATLVEWAMAELIKNPRVLKKAQDELDQMIGSKRIMTEWDFSNLPYLRCVAKEALRLHPPTPLMLPHTANTPVKVGGYDIPKGTNVHVNIRAIARDPSIWKSPLEFRPERFMEEDVDMKGHDFRFLPFGAGRRACPAAQLGSNLVTSMLGHLLHHFDWSIPGVGPADIDMGETAGLVAHMQTPLEVNVTPRLPEQLY